jgi:poly-beta-1,6-N-acetyl-D-glucosamine synthase
MRLAVVIPFLNEQQLLPQLLGSIATQTRPPDWLLLVDDGSTDASPAIAAEFVREHGYASLARRAVRAGDDDRLRDAHELRAFEWALSALEEPWDVVAKLDADLRLAPGTFADVLARFERDPRLGIAGPRLLSVDHDGRDVSHRTRPEHVEGAARFYRRPCLSAIAPIPPILGWDTIDEVHARSLGWQTRSLELPGPPTVHLRPTGGHDGVVRGFRRWGECAWAYGAHPLNVLAGAVHRMGRRPYVLGGLSYLAGWGLAAARSVPRARPEVRAFCRAEQRDRARRALAARVRAA